MKSSTSVSRRSAIAKILATATALAVGLLGQAPAYAASVSGAVFTGGTGTVSVGGTLYAKQGDALTLTVTTDTATDCLQLAGAITGDLSNFTAITGARRWTSSLTAGPNDGVQTVTATPFPNYNVNGNKCSGSKGSPVDASFTLDNTGPIVTATKTPAANGAGWNKSTVSISWLATDAGSGVASGPTPGSDSASANFTDQNFTSAATDRVGNSTTGSTPVKLDKAAPTITGNRTPATFNSAGWNSTDVTVSFTCADQNPGSGIKACTPQQTFTSTGSVIGTAVDNADNSTSTAPFDVKIDKTAPTLSGAPTTSPNTSGWYSNNVVVHWTGADALSGIIAQPSDSTISGEGQGLTTSATVTNNAGLTTTAASAPGVNIDKTAPNTTVTAPPAWNESDVTLTLVPNDGLSGVVSTFYKLDAGSQQSGTSIAVTAAGNHTLQFWSVDRAGNTEATRSVAFGIDKTSPTIGHTQSPLANDDGWNNGDVKINFACSDALSGIASCTVPQTVTTEGKFQTVTGTATDNAGNSAADPAQVSIDRSKPIIGVTLDRTANGNGWYGDDVTATFSCADQTALSGVKSCSTPEVFGEGTNQIGTGTATDAAGNSASVTTPILKIDKTAPTVSGTVVTQPNSNGWFSSDVTVHWTCDDNLSGVVSCPSDSVVTGEGGNLGASVSVVDKAGHPGTGAVSGVKIDRTTPGTAAVGVPTGWQNAPVTVGLLATDNLSGVDSTHYSVDGGADKTGVDVTLGTDGTHAVSYYSVDNAGNREAANSFTVQVDLSSPTIDPSQSPAANGNGWNNGDVTVSFACNDQVGLSGVANCPNATTVTTEGEGQAVTGTTTDNAGNSTSGTATVNLDKTGPTISGGPDRAPNANGWWKDDVTVSFACGDALSGVYGCSDPANFGQGENQGVTGNVTDNAGNSASKAVGGINIDEVAPTLSAAPTTEANGNGWYHGDVTLTWACGDDLSRVVTCPQDTVLEGEGDNLVAGQSITDNAGNDTSASSEPVKIDRTAPSTDVSAPSGWVNSSVDITLKPFDALSGVDATHYSVDSGTDQTGTTVTLTEEGTHTISYGTTDMAGNVEVARHVTVLIDKSNPTITHALSPKANGNDWNHADVTVTFTCDDQGSLSGIASCTAPQTVTDEGQGQAVTGTATDKAGNFATDAATVSLDKTKPTINGSRAPAANGDGWNNTDVTVSFNAADALSGVDTTTGDQTLTEGENQSVTGTVVDAAGNDASDTVSGINVDETDPTLSGKPTTAANGNGWYKDDVAIGWTCGDPLSGVAVCPGNSIISSEGDPLAETATVTDKAGNSTTADSVAVKIDRHAPVTGADAPDGWNDSKVTVALDATDGLSGVDATYYTVDGGVGHEGTTLTIESHGVHSVSYWSVDRAGNVESAKTATVKIDLVKPTVKTTVTPAPNAHGWNNSRVSVSYACADDLSGIASCTKALDVTAEGQDQAVPGTAEDLAGNNYTDPATVSIDFTKPTIHGTPDRAANDAGWYDSDVTVAFACNDSLSGIVEDGCPSESVLGEGKAQSVKGTATDTAGNQAGDTVSPVNVDKTAPTLSGAPSTSANDAGWYTGDVTVNWTCADALSGIPAGACPANSVIDGEGQALTAGESVKDLAGNPKSASSPAVDIDRHAPTTTVSDVSGWSNGDVTVRLDAKDNLSDVKATHYQLDSAPAATGTSVTISSEGVHTLQVWSVDNAGNVEAQQNIAVKIDKTAPGIGHTASPVANAKGWNKSDVSVSFTCTDSGSGVASCTGSRTLTTEGSKQAVEGKAKDNAGNTATDTTDVSIDKTKPTASVSLSATPNANTWFNANVTATYACADPLSGISKCPAGVTFGEGTGQSDSGKATDAADNDSDAAGVSGVNVDKTDPTLSGSASPAANGAGWRNGDVTITWRCADVLSGIATGDCPNPATLTGEGNDLGAQASVSDRAGNTAGRTVGDIKIDRHGPNTVADAPTGWQNKDVTVNLSATDNLSGVASTHYTIDGGATQDGTSVVVSVEGTHTVDYWSRDTAGNVESKKTVMVYVDKTAPRVTASPDRPADSNGYYTHSVTVSFDCSDTASGVASCPTPVRVTQSTTVTGIAYDNAGNKGAGSFAVAYDGVAPNVTIGGVTDGAVYTLGNVPTPTCSATDNESGLAGACTGARTGGTANGVGSYTYAATATDKAGNVGIATATYKVQYGFGTAFFLQPINDTAHQTGLSTSVFKAGSTVPVKFQLRKADGTIVQANTAPIWEVPAKGSGMTAAVNESAYSASADSTATFRWDATAQQYIYNWNTSSSQAGSYWRIGVKLDDGTTQFVNIGLK
jgi:large repetitive protein